MRLLASALGMGEVYKANQAACFILLLDGKKRNVLARLTSQQTLKEMSAALNALLEKQAQKLDENQQDSVSP